MTHTRERAHRAGGGNAKACKRQARVFAFMKSKIFLSFSASRRVPMHREPELRREWLCEQLTGSQSPKPLPKRVEKSERHRANEQHACFPTKELSLANPARRSNSDSHAPTERLLKRRSRAARFRLRRNLPRACFRPAMLISNSTDFSRRSINRLKKR